MCLHESTNFASLDVIGGTVRVLRRCEHCGKRIETDRRRASPDEMAADYHDMAWSGAIVDKPRLGLGHFRRLRDMQRVWM